MEIQQTPEQGLDPLLSIDELADYLGLPVRTIYAWRTEGKGPRGVLLGKHVKFLHHRRPGMARRAARDVARPRHHRGR